MMDIEPIVHADTLKTVQELRRQRPELFTVSAYESIDGSIVGSCTWR